MHTLLKTYTNNKNPNDCVKWHTIFGNVLSQICIHKWNIASHTLDWKCHDCFLTNLYIWTEVFAFSEIHPLEWKSLPCQKSLHSNGVVCLTQNHTLEQKCLLCHKSIYLIGSTVYCLVLYCIARSIHLNGSVVCLVRPIHLNGSIVSVVDSKRWDPITGWLPHCGVASGWPSAN